MAHSAFLQPMFQNIKLRLPNYFHSCLGVLAQNPLWPTHRRKVTSPEDRDYMAEEPGYTAKERSYMMEEHG